MKHPPLDEAKKASNLALRYLALRDRTEQEILTYLNKKGFSSATVEHVMDRLRSWRYLDDTRVALNWARDRIERHQWGPARVIVGLKRRGVNSRVIEEVMETVVAGRNERTMAERAVERYLRTHPDVRGARGMRRLSGYLGRRGYSRGVIGEINREVFGEEPPENGRRND